MKPDFHHLQISLRLPHWVVTRIDGIAAAEYTNRASVLRKLLAGAVGCKPTPSEDASETTKELSELPLLHQPPRNCHNFP